MHTTPSTRSTRESCHPMALRALQRAASSTGVRLLSSGIRSCRIGATLGPTSLASSLCSAALRSCNTLKFCTGSSLAGSDSASTADWVVNSCLAEPSELPLSAPLLPPDKSSRTTALAKGQLADDAGNSRLSCWVRSLDAVVYR